MSDFLLAQGSIVKTGILSTQLPAMLESGLSPEASATGIAVGELSAYHHAARLFCQHLQQLHQQHQEVLAAFVKELQDQPGQPPSTALPAAIGEQAALPLVLEIVLGQNCVLHADAHYADNDAEKSWKTWRSGWLEVPDGRLPAAWIRRFYFPRLLDFRDAANHRSARSREQSTDVALMTGGYMQHQLKDAPAGLLMAYHRQYGRINFSQSLPFDAEHVSRFQTLHAVQDSATLVLNQMSLWQDLLAMTQKQKIDLSAG